MSKLTKKPLIIESESTEVVSTESETQGRELEGEGPFLSLNCNYDLEKEYNKLDCNNSNYYSVDCNKFLLKKELVERECLKEHPEENLYLYPNLNDALFNVKIAEKKEFNDTKYDGTIYKNIKEYADILSKADFE